MFRPTLFSIKHRNSSKKYLPINVPHFHSGANIAKNLAKGVFVFTGLATMNLVLAFQNNKTTTL